MSCHIQSNLCSSDKSFHPITTARNCCGHLPTTHVESTVHGLLKVGVKARNLVSQVVGRVVGMQQESVVVHEVASVLRLLIRRHWCNDTNAPLDPIDAGVPGCMRSLGSPRSAWGSSSSVWPWQVKTCTPGMLSGDSLFLSSPLLPALATYAERYSMNLFIGLAILLALVTSERLSSTDLLAHASISLKGVSESLVKILKGA
ncbi:hypothetical protein KCU85_g38, partial [Aureobasidium melanogenum]